MKNRTKHKNKTKVIKRAAKVIIGLATVATAAAALAMLFAPETGKEMRKKIADTAKDWLDDFLSENKDLVSQVEKTTQDNMDETSAKIKDLLKRT